MPILMKSRRTFPSGNFRAVEKPERYSHSGKDRTCDGMKPVAFPGVTGSDPRVPAAPEAEAYSQICVGSEGTICRVWAY